MNLNASRRSRQDGERIGALLRIAASIEDRNEVAEIHAGAEAAPFVPGHTLKSERIGDERHAEFGEGESINGNIFPFRLLLQERQPGFTPTVHGLADEQ